MSCQKIVLWIVAWGFVLVFGSIAWLLVTGAFIAEYVRSPIRIAGEEFVAYLFLDAIIIMFPSSIIAAGGGVLLARHKSVIIRHSVGFSFVVIVYVVNILICGLWVSKGYPGVL